MYRRPFGPCIRITLKELIASIMVAEERTSIRTGELYNCYLDLIYKIKQKGINCEVLYSRDKLNEFKHENENQFDVGVGYIALKGGYNIDWLQEAIVSRMSNKKLEILGLISQENDYSL